MSPIEKVALVLCEHEWGVDTTAVSDEMELHGGYWIDAAKAALSCLIEMADDERVKLWLTAMLEG